MEQTSKTAVNQFDYFFTKGDYAALVLRQPLKPVEGNGAVIFPPTFADIGYNIDTIQNSDSLNNVCLIDSVGSQANRMEPIFKEPAYKSLVPQAIVEISKKKKTAVQDEPSISVNILDAGHRIADAVFRFSNAAGDIAGAFAAMKKGNALPLAKLAPTSIVFGCWDSRDSGVKLPRIVRSTIQATNVHKLTRSAQYVPATDKFEEAFDDLKKEEKKKFADIGLAHVPSSGSPGGVILDTDSKIFREAVLSLSALRSLRAETDENTVLLRRYIFALSLVALTASYEPLLRMGCELTGDPSYPATWESVKCSGEREPLQITHDVALAFAQAAAKEFVIEQDKSWSFDPTAVKAALKKTEAVSKL